MGLGGSLSGISFGGLASGIDSDSIIRRLIQLEGIPVQRLQVQQANLSAKMGAIQQFKSILSALSVASGALNSSAAFNPIAATSSTTEVATVSADTTAAAGIYALSVSKLAQANKISSAAQVDTTTALGQSGTFVVNGKSVKVEATDTLRMIATKVNSAGAGVTASLIDGGGNKAYLTFTASKSGAANKVQVGDFEGSVLSNLGLVTGAATFREPSAGGGSSYGFSSPTTTLASQMNLANPTTKTFTINEVQISIDLSTATLSSIAAAISSSGSGATASVVASTVNGATVHKLQVSNAPTLEDDDGLMEAIGVLQSNFGTQLVGAQDATFTIDGVAMTSATNTVTTVIPGATLTLLKANETTPETSTLSLSRDAEGIKKKVREFKEAYNGVVDFVKAATGLDKDTFDSGILFGDGATQQVESSISALVFNTVAGLTSSYKNLSQLGFTFDTDSKLVLNEATLDTAIADNADAVGAAFRAIGTTTVSGMSYVSSSEKTRPSGAAGFAVKITQLSIKGAYTGEVAQTTLTTNSEELTFNGAAFGSTPYALTISPGKTQAEIVTQINNDSKLKDLVTASIDGGKLKIESKKFGTAGAFTVVSNVAAAGDTSGIGLASGGTTVTALDVAGSIGGQAATGAGQYLTSSTGDAEGLQISYSGTVTGDVGNLLFTKGTAAQMVGLVATFNDSVNGLLTSNDKSLQAQVDSISTSITGLQERIQRKEVELRAKFTRMEQAIAALQGQQAQFATFS